MHYLKENKVYLTLSLLFLFFSRASHAEEANPEQLNIPELTENVLFVGLGSYCEAADVLRSCGVRKAAFPFDWILTGNGRKLVELLENDFSGFMDEPHLTPALRSKTVLLQTYYEMEFHHEGEWRGDRDYLSQNMRKLIDKYQNRVKRFRQLNDYAGKVFFIRFANQYSLEPNVHYRRKENLEITEESASLLYHTLRKYFPNLNFQLVIVNTHNRDGLEEEELRGHVLMIRTNPLQPVHVKKSYYTKLFNKLAAREDL